MRGGGRIVGLATMAIPARLSARLLAGAALLLGALLILHVHPAFAQEKSLLWERFDVDIIIRRDGAFEVAEHQTIRFTRGTFTFGFREIPTRYIDSIDRLDPDRRQWQPLSSGEQRQRALYLHRCR